MTRTPSSRFPEGHDVSESIRVVVADHHPLIRVGLRATLAEAGGIEVAGEAADCAQALRLCQRLAPDVLLVALGLPGPPTAEVVARLRSSPSPVRALVLADHDPIDVNALVRAGAAGVRAEGRGAPGTPCRPCGRSPAA